MSVPTNLIPTKITGLPEYTGSDTLGYFPYVLEGRTYKVQFANLAGVGAVPSTRVVAAGTGLTGGGDLSQDRVIAIANGGVGYSQLAASGVSPGVYGSASTVPILTIDDKGRVTSATTASITISGYVPDSRLIAAGPGITGGGQLSSNLTLGVDFTTSLPQALGTASAGVSTAAARGDHVHPAVNLSDANETQGALPLGRGGTGDALSPVAGAVVYSTGTKFALADPGTPGQVLTSDGAGEPYWSTVTGTGTVTSVNASGGTTGMTFTGGPITGAGTLTLGGTLAIANGGTGATTASVARANLGAAASGANSDITSMSGITGAIATPDYIDFDTAATVTRATGRLWWDNADGNQTLSLGMAGSNATLQIGEEMYFRVKASAPITEGQVVMFTGTVGASGALTAAPATGLDKNTASYVMGVATETIATNGWGYITQFGLVRGINTTGGAEAWVDGQILYYNPAVPGGLTKTVPTAPAAKVEVAAVVHAASNGSLFVRPSFRFSLTQLNDVESAGASNLDLLQYNGTGGYWQHVSPSTITVGTATTVNNLAGGAANRIAYQTGVGATSFIAAPTVANTYLEWSGSAFQWSANPLGTVTSVNASGGTTGLTFSGGPITTSGTLTLAGTLGVANGGTGAASLSSGYLLKGNGTSAVSSSVVYDTGTNVGIGTSSPLGKFDTTSATGHVGFNTGTSSSPERGNLWYDTDGTGWKFNIGKLQGGAFTSQMTFQDNGNVGLGTTSPSYRLDIPATGTVAAYLGGIKVGANGTDIVGDLGILSLQATGANYMGFSTNGSERMRISSGGNIGVGTSSPGFRLQVAADSTDPDGGQLVVTGSTNTNKRLSLGFNTTDNYGFAQALIAGDNYYPLVLQPSFGNVGISNTSPSYKLDITGSAARIKSTFAYSALLLSSADANASTRNWAVGSNLNTYGDFVIQQSNAQGGDPLTAGTARIAIGASGNVGIGTTSPDDKLTVNGGGTFYTGSTDRLVISPQTAGSGALLLASNSTNTAYAPIILDGSTNIFRISGTERVRIDSSGNVGIGTSSPVAYAGYGNLTLQGTNGGTLTLRNSANTGSSEMAATASEVYFKSVASAPLWFGTNNTERMRIDSSGNVGIGVTGPTYKLQIAAPAGAQNIFLAGQSGVSNGYVISSNGSALTYQWYKDGAEAMRLDSSGNLGIGTTAPVSRLHALSSSNTTVSVESSGATSLLRGFAIISGSTEYATFKQRFDTGEVQLTAGVAGWGGFMTFHTNGSEKMRLDGSGNFYVDGGTGKGRITLENGASVNTIFSTTTAFGAYNTLNLAASAYTWKLNNSTQAMTLNSSGNVGIGTSSPLTRLHVDIPSTTQNYALIGNASNGIGVGVQADGSPTIFNYANKGIIFAGNYNTSLTEQMRIDSSGNVGIGTSSPGLPLDVQSNASGLGIRIRGRAADSNGYLQFSSNNLASSSYIGSDGSSLRFDTSGTERMRIDSSGNVGIGTSSPLTKLDISGSFRAYQNSSTGIDAAVFQNSNSGSNTTKVVNVLYQGADTIATIKNVGLLQYGPADVNWIGSYFAIQTRSGDTLSERMRIDSSGNVGIGTSSPSAKLHVSGSSVGNSNIRLTNILAPRSWEFNPYTTGDSDSKFAIRDVTAAADRIAIDSSGNVGIGTSSPGFKLDVVQSGVVGIRVQNSASTADAYLQTQNTLGAGLFGVGAIGQYMYTAQNIPTLFYNNGTERMRIDSSGNVGIGTSSPASKLHVAGTGFFTGASSISTGAGVGVEYIGGGAINSRDYGAGTWDLMDYGASQHSFYIGGTGPAMRINSSSYVLIGYSASNGAYRLQVNSQIFATSSTIATSDGRYKENVTPLTGALETVNALNPVSFDWKAHPVHNFDRAQPTVGFIAQEVQQALADKPYLNSVVKSNQCTLEDGSTEEFLGIAEGNLIALLTAALKEASAKIDDLTARVAQLEGN